MQRTQRYYPLVAFDPRFSTSDRIFVAVEAPARDDRTPSGRASSAQRFSRRVIEVELVLLQLPEASVLV